MDGAPLDLTLTTNGSLLARKARALKDAGLQRVTVSLDGLDDAVFRRMNDVDFPVADVLKGIDAARAAGLGPVKINMVVKRGTNEHEILPMARHFKGTGIVLRFIEYMDVGATNGWRMDEVMPSAEVVKLIHAELPLVQLEPSAPGETAERWGYADGTRRDRRDQQRHPGVLRRLQPRPAVHRRPALPVPVRQPRPRPAHAHPRRRAEGNRAGQRRGPGFGDRARSGRAAPTATRSCAPPWRPTRAPARAASR